MKFRGAEAIVETIDWNGQTVISKIRNKRGYRHPSLEKRLVVERLRSESRIMARLLSQGIPVPAVYSVNTSDNSIFMEFIDGQTLERALRKKDFKTHLVQTAEVLSKIHSLNVVQSFLLVDLKRRAFSKVLCYFLHLHSIFGHNPTVDGLHLVHYLIILFYHRSLQFLSKPFTR